MIHGNVGRINDPRLLFPGICEPGKVSRKQPAARSSPDRQRAVLLADVQLPLTFPAQPITYHCRIAAATLPVRAAPPRKLLKHRYELGVLRGTGGMASVYSAIDRRIGRPVAIKLFHPEVARGAFINDIIRGSRAAASLSHPFIASVFDVDVDNERPFVVMELVEGPSLARLIEAHGASASPGDPLPWSRIVRIAQHICAALSCLQQHHLIHGDLKPSNVVLTCSHSLKLIDLDLCTLGGRNPIMRRVGTFPWMSPEQSLYGMRDVVSELFTVGVLLYQLTTGELPFRGSAEEVLYKLEHRDFVRPRTAAPSMPPAIEQIVLTAMEIRHRRYTCTQALIQALEASLKNPTVAGWERPRDDGSHQSRTTPAPRLTLTHLSTTSLGQGRIRRSALECLHGMLCSMFDREEFRRLVVLGLAGGHLLDQLDPCQSGESLVLTTIELLARRGMIDAAFFHRVGEQRPHRWEEVQSLADSLSVGDELAELRRQE